MTKDFLHKTEMFAIYYTSDITDGKVLKQKFLI